MNHKLKRPQLAKAFVSGHWQQGFSLVEVMAAILLLAIFTMIGGSLMVYAAAMRKVALEGSSLTDRLHRDVEQIRDLAASLPVDAAACMATVDTAGYASRLSSAITSNSTLPANFDLKVSGETLAVNRTLAPRNVAPFNILQLTYTVTAPSKPPVTALQAEVIPNAALSCY